MVEFKLRNRPKKPKGPSSLELSMDVRISLVDLYAKVKEFLEKNRGIGESDIILEAEWGLDDYPVLCLSAPNKSLRCYSDALDQYKLDLKEYKFWQLQNQEEIEDFKTSEKKRIAHDKLLRAKVRIEKEMVEIEAKLTRTA